MGKEKDRIALTSPHTRGERVEAAQKHLKHNEFGTFYGGPIDGVFNEHTADASMRAKYKLGYPDSSVRGSYGSQLEDYLEGRTRLSPIMRLRRRRRQKAAEEAKNVKKRALQIGLKEVGVHEAPANSNRVKYSDWYGVVGPWCAMFFTWCQIKAAEDLHTTTSWAQGDFSCYCPQIVGAAHGHARNLRITNDPEPGDAVLYQFDSDSQADHIGRFIRWENKGAGTFKSLEGNTSLTSNDNGGEVMVRTRDRSLVQHFIRVDE